MAYSVSTYTYGPTSSAGPGMSNAQIKAWAALFLASMTANGWSQTSDTGQLVPSTITADQVVAATALGYFIFKLNDSYSATDPVYLRCNLQMIGVGQNASPSGDFGPQIVNTIGFATDGAGNITGNQVNCGAAAVGPGYLLNYKPALEVFAGGEGWATVFHGIGFALNSVNFYARQICALTVVRMRNASGVVQAGQIFITYPEPSRVFTSSSGGAYYPYQSATGSLSSNTVRMFSAYLPKAGTVISGLPVTPGVIGNLSSSGSVGGVIQAQPTWMFYPQIAPHQQLILVPSSIFTAGQIFTASIDGVSTYSYACLGASAGAGSASEVAAMYAIDSFSVGTYCFAARVI